MVQKKLESPARNRERHIDRGITCPGISIPRDVGYPYPTLDMGSTPIQSWTGAVLDRGGPVPGSPHPYQGPNLARGKPRGRDLGPVELLWNGDGVVPRKDTEPVDVEVLWDGDG